jgi:ABC-type nitrate/sulfonate/bicarbonate transport system permease component
MADAAGQAARTPGGEPDATSWWQDPVRIAQLLFPLALLALWQILAVVLGDFFVASPLAAFGALLEGVGAGWLGANAGITLAALV